ncbi:hypothetical protein D1007_52175 [Hordeum vulgare]|nr:hypothetical protein D1007_52175 [Hordeum vulgare]
MRQIKGEVGIVSSADGSALFDMGNTRVIVVVYGPREVISVFILVGAIFVPIGVASLLSSGKVDAETVIEVGDPKETICQTADQLNVDLLILGSQSRGPI